MVKKKLKAHFQNTKVLAFAFLFSFVALPIFALENTNPIVDGYNAYKNEDWTSAVMFFRKAFAEPKNVTADSWYMLIVSEIHAGDFKTASADCDYFFSKFKDSIYTVMVQYQKGRVAFCLGDYEKAVLILSDFCHQNKDSDMYPSALFWIAESFFASYNFEQAKPFYERIVSEYPAFGKSAQAQYRIEVITQRNREEKLLYLLKQTGEEYLSLKEEYEKKQRIYEMEKTGVSDQTLKNFREQNENLSKSLDEQKQTNEALLSKIKEYEESISSSKKISEFEDDINQLKADAAAAEKLLNP